jgi:hypothetical protein
MSVTMSLLLDDNLLTVFGSYEHHEHPPGLYLNNPGKSRVIAPSDGGFSYEERSVAGQLRSAT